MENGDVNTAESSQPSRWLRVGIGIALVLSVLLIGAGYLIGAGLGGDDGGPEAGASDGGPAKYAACMRENGVANFPEPGSDGRLRINPQDGVDVQSDAFKSAEAACESLWPEDAPPPQAQPGPIPAGSQQASFVPLEIDTKDYVACMRENGVPDFPDPVNGMFNYDARTDAVRAANKICGRHLPSNAPPPQ
jgi:hypothetical protein